MCAVAVAFHEWTTYLQRGMCQWSLAVWHWNVIINLSFLPTRTLVALFADITGLTPVAVIAAVVGNLMLSESFASAFQVETATFSAVAVSDRDARLLSQCTARLVLTALMLRV